jgi:hypothetical protein
MKNHHWCRRTVPAVLIAAVLGTAAHTASAAPTSDDPAAAERARLVEITAQMPAGWPATEVMRQAAEGPALSAAELQRLQQDAARMPAGWPATEAMRKAAEGPAATTESQDRQDDVDRMPAGWPATEVMRQERDAPR